MLSFSKPAATLAHCFIVRIGERRGFYQLLTTLTTVSASSKQNPEGRRGSSVRGLSGGFIGNREELKLSDNRDSRMQRSG